MASCPECDADLEVDDDDLEEMEVGDPWDCDSCGSRLRVAVLDPLDFDSDEEDDDEDEDSDDDEEDVDEESEEDDDEGDGGDWQD